jgi:hypothetical protein
MTPERHIWACANSLLQQHGDNAWFHASRRADQLLLAGDLDGNAMFRAILARIAHLDNLTPSGMVQ